MSSLNSLSQCAIQRHNEKWPWFIVCHENLHRKPFQRKAGEESSLFLLFLFFFLFHSFLFFCYFLSSTGQITPTNAVGDYVAAIPWLRLYDARLQMKAAQMQFAFAFTLNMWQPNYYRNSLFYTISGTTARRPRRVCRYLSARVSRRSRKVSLRFRLEE